MKYIKSINEILSINGLDEELLSDIHDMLLEITDLGYEYTIQKSIYSTGFSLTISNENVDDFNIIKDCVLRIKYYLGERYLRCSLFRIGKGWVSIELDESLDMKNSNFIMYLRIYFI